MFIFSPFLTGFHSLRVTEFCVAAILWLLAIFVVCVGVIQVLRYHIRAYSIQPTMFRFFSISFAIAADITETFQVFLFISRAFMHLYHCSLLFLINTPTVSPPAVSRLSSFVYGFLGWYRGYNTVFSFQWNFISSTGVVWVAISHCYTALLINCTLCIKVS